MHRVAQVAEPTQGAEQPLVVALVQPDARLVEDVEHADQSRADLGGQPDPLRLAAGEGPGSAPERQVLEPDIAQEAKPVGHLLEDRAGDVGIDAARDAAPERDALEKREASSTGSSTMSPMLCPPPAPTRLSGLSRRPPQAGTGLLDHEFLEPSAPRRSPSRDSGVRRS